MPLCFLWVFPVDIQVLPVISAPKKKEVNSPLENRREGFQGLADPGQ